ncbi:MAG TPA: hypothetical protein VFK52_10705 [Nocardioidaceae bacterium]|nr:hypothetical protein [Nocardioidaceae bacterium]
MSAVTHMHTWRPGPDLASKFRSIRRWYSLEVLHHDKALNQETFSALVGFGAKAWAAWETGRNQPDDLDAVARQLLDTIGLDPSYLTASFDDGPRDPSEQVNQSSPWMTDDQRPALRVA